MERRMSQRRLNQWSKTNENPRRKAVSGSQRSLAEVGDPKEEWAARCSAESSGASFCDLRPSGRLLRLESLYNTVLSPSASVFRFSLSFPPPCSSLGLITTGLLASRPFDTPVYPIPLYLYTRYSLLPILIPSFFLSSLSVIRTPPLPIQTENRQVISEIMASTSDQFFYLDSPTQFEEWVDFDQFLDLPSAYGDEYSASASTNSVSPDMALPYDAEMLSTDLLDFGPSAFPDMLNYDASQESFFADLSPEMGMIDDHAVAMDDSTFYDYPQYDASFDFRQVVEAQAAADPRVASIKEKRREAAIALHLQRLCEATALDLDMSSDSNTSFSSPAWSEYVRGSNSPQSTSASPKTPSAPAPAAGGVEMVLDLNMNTAANLPKKQKPRSQAQKENYIKARKYGACEKHKKQHKRVSSPPCLDPQSLVRY